MATTRRPILRTPFDPKSPDYLRDPYSTLARMRDEGPVLFDPTSGKWFLVGFHEVETGLSQITRNPADDPRRAHFPDNPFAADGPGHNLPRRLITPDLSNRAVQRLRDRVQQIVDEALADKIDGSQLRVVEEIGFELPYHITRDLLGVPDVDNVAELREWTWQSLELIDAFLTPEELRDDLVASSHLAGHLDRVYEWKRDHLGDDFFSKVIRAGDAGEIMRTEQIVPYIHTLYLAGMHTTVNQTALSLHSLLSRRDQWELLRSRPDLLENAVEELLRFESTAQYMRRTGGTETEISGVTIPAGEEVVCWIASANRDETQWGPDADELDITRTDARHHIAFGKGAHVCLGSWLARMELHVVIETILTRFPNSELAVQDLVWTSNVIRGPEELLVTLRD